VVENVGNLDGARDDLLEIGEAVLDELEDKVITLESGGVAEGGPAERIALIGIETRIEKLADALGGRIIDDGGKEEVPAVVVSRRLETLAVHSALNPPLSDEISNLGVRPRCREVGHAKVDALDLDLLLKDTMAYRASEARNSRKKLVLRAEGEVDGR